MPRKSPLIAPLVVFVLLILAVPSPSPALNGPGVIRITQRHVGGGSVDIGLRGPSIGDVQVLRELLYNTNITPNPIGHAEITCIYTGTTSRNCSGTFFLPRGKIVVSGPLLYRQFFELAVVGGTGLYSNVRGTLTVTSLSSGKRASDVLLFRLVP
jgi:hypothetical protein